MLLVGATTENPRFSVVAPLLSRSLVLGLHALDDAAVGTLLDRAVADPRGLGGTRDARRRGPRRTSSGSPRATGAAP